MSFLQVGHVGREFCPYLSLVITLQLIKSLGELHPLEEAASGWSSPPRPSWAMGAPSPRTYRPFLTQYISSFLPYSLPIAGVNAP